jgi:uncharacterized membrane protein
MNIIRNATLIVKIKNQYGIDRIYPVNTTAHLMAKIANRKTLDRDHIETAKQLGYTVTVENQQL